MALPLKSFEYLFHSAFGYTGIIAFVFPSGQILVIWGSAFLSMWFFLFLINRPIFKDFKRFANQAAVTQQAQLYNSLLANSHCPQNNPLTPVRAKALQYCQELIDDYKKTRGISRNFYYIFQLATVILSGITPIFVLLDQLHLGISWFKWLPVIFPATASLVASIVTSFPFQKNWISANTTVELLEAEQEKFILGVTEPYRCYDVTDETQREQKAKQGIENFITQVNSIHLQQIQELGEQKLKREKTQNQ